MTSGPSVIRKPTLTRSNIELVHSLQANIFAARNATTDSRSGTNDWPNEGKHEPARGREDDARDSSWTSLKNDTLYIPSHRPTQLMEPRSFYSITVKLFYLPGISPSRRRVHTSEAISLVLEELGVNTVDLVIVSYPGVTFDADDDDSEASSMDEEQDASHEEAPERMEAMIETWRVVEGLHEKGIIKNLGVSDFSSERLASFLPKIKTKPSTDQINVKDCCVVPKSLIDYAEQENIELLTHKDCTNILQPGTIRELLGTGQQGAGILATAAQANDSGLRGDVQPQWVVKYTAVVEDRGVIENKGYFAMAELEGHPMD